MFVSYIDADLTPLSSSLGPVFSSRPVVPSLTGAGGITLNYPIGLIAQRGTNGYSDEVYLRISLPPEYVIGVMWTVFIAGSRLPLTFNSVTPDGFLALFVIPDHQFEVQFTVETSADRRVTYPRIKVELPKKYLEATTPPNDIGSNIANDPDNFDSKDRNPSYDEFDPNINILVP